MINPNNIIDFNRTKAELEELILFLVIVAGKNAATMSKALDRFLSFNGRKNSLTPFGKIKFLDSFDNPDWNLLDSEIKRAGFGQYTRIGKAFRELAYSDLNLETCTLEDLMKIHGIGRKSASCFLAWTREGAFVAMLDTHLLKYLAKTKEDLSKINAVGLLSDIDKPVLEKLNSVTIPKSTPSSTKVYNALEEAFLMICDKMDMTPAEWDLEIWRHYSNKLDKQIETVKL